MSILVLLVGCTTNVVGTASPSVRSSSGPTSSASSEPGPASAGPLDELLGHVPLRDQLGEHLVARSLVVRPDGGAILLAGNGNDETSDYVIELLPGADGLEIGEVHEVPNTTIDADVHVAPDGTVIVTDRGEDPTSPRPFRMVVAAPGSAEPEQRIVTGLDAGLPPDRYDALLSPDGQTLYAGLAWNSRLDNPPARLAAIDVATGEVTGFTELPVGLEQSVTAFVNLAVRPDGGLTALVEVELPAGDDGRRFAPVLAQFDADLALLGEPVELLGDGETGFPQGLQLTPDGASVVGVFTLEEGRRPFRLLVVRDGEVTDEFPLDVAVERPWNFALDPSGQYAYVPYGDESGQLVLGTVDLRSGEIASTVPLCPAVDLNVLPALVTLDPDAQTATVAATCTDKGLVDTFRVR